MKYLISWVIPQESFIASATRFLETGGAPPPGVKLLSRWHGMSGAGFAVVESDDAKAMYLYRAQWADVLTIDVTPCLDDAEAGPVIAAAMTR